jgi:hypothetical protein
LKNKRERKHKKGKWRALRARTFEDKMLIFELHNLQVGCDLLTL